VLTAQAALASDEQKLVRVRAFSYLVSKLTKKATMVVIGNNTYHWRSCAVGFTTALFKGEVYTVWGSNAKPGYACMFDAALALQSITLVGDSGFQRTVHGLQYPMTRQRARQAHLTYRRHDN